MHSKKRSWSSGNFLAESRRAAVFNHLSMLVHITGRSGEPTLDLTRWPWRLAN